MRKVTMVVPVLITSCQVSLQWKRGPLIAQATTTVSASAKVAGRPVAYAVPLAKRVNQDFDLAGVMLHPS